MTTRISEDVIPMTDLNTSAEEREFMHAVAAGLADLEAGRDLSMEEALERLGIR
ncbi:MAG: hypothetical protein OXI45_06525 [Acidobacteriota bacterium]|nr:hypothetical protein [Acidobacteriota bacterium]